MVYQSLNASAYKFHSLQLRLWLHIKATLVLCLNRKRVLRFFMLHTTIHVGLHPHYQWAERKGQWYEKALLSSDISTKVLVKWGSVSKPNVQIFVSGVYECDFPHFLPLSCEDDSLSATNNSKWTLGARNINCNLWIMTLTILFFLHSSFFVSLLTGNALFDYRTDHQDPR